MVWILVVALLPCAVSRYAKRQLQLRVRFPPRSISFYDQAQQELDRNHSHFAMKTHCCDKMSEMVAFRCDLHLDRFDCPDCLIHYSSHFDTYGIIIHDGGQSMMAIAFCPWCGTCLPEFSRSEIVPE